MKGIHEENSNAPVTDQIYSSSHLLAQRPSPNSKRIAAPKLHAKSSSYSKSPHGRQPPAPYGDNKVSKRYGNENVNELRQRVATAKNEQNAEIKHILNNLSYKDHTLGPE